MSAVGDLVTSLREKYEAPLVMTAKLGSIYDLGMIVGAELTQLLSDATEDVVLNYLHGVRLGFELAALRSENVASPLTHSFTINPEDPRRIILPESMNLLAPSGTIIEAYLAVEPFEAVFNAIKDSGKLNTGRHFVDVAPFSKPLMIRVIGL